MKDRNSQLGDSQGGEGYRGLSGVDLLKLLAADRDVLVDCLKQAVG
jgi:hypothetical protein